MPVNSEKKIRVAMVAPMFPLDGRVVDGGVSGVSLYLCRALAQRPDVELTVIRPCTPPAHKGLFAVDGIRCEFLSRPAWHPHLYHILRSVRLQIAEALARIAPDVVHEQGHTMVAELPHPVVHTIHGIAERDIVLRGSRLTAGIRGLILGFLSRRSRCGLANVIAISPYVRGFLGDPAQQRVWDIANPIDDRFFVVARRPQPGTVFSASRMSALKNVQGLIRAFAESQAAIGGGELRLAGSGQDSEYGRECRRLAGELGVAERVKFLGVLPVDQVCAELARASVFALASVQENAPLSIAEAMAAGVPVLATGVGGVPWMVADGQAGRVVPPGDSAALCAGLCDLLATDALARMGACARDIAKRRFFALSVAEQTVLAYREILAEQASRKLGSIK